jgi:hypothetical protein
MTETVCEYITISVRRQKAGRVAWVTVRAQVWKITDEVFVAYDQDGDTYHARREFSLRSGTADRALLNPNNRVLFEPADLEDASQAPKLLAAMAEFAVKAKRI